MTGPKPIAGVVLAAGFSRRLGRPKQLVMLGGETLVQRAACGAAEAGLQPVVVVVNGMVQEAVAEQLEALGCKVVLNCEAEEGMAASIRCGLSAISQDEVAGVVLMTCDQVAVTPEHLRHLCAQPAITRASAYAGRLGVPAYFPAERFAELRALHGEEGARKLLREAEAVQTEALAFDVDTEEDVVRAQAYSESRRLCEDRKQTRES